jgi:hypothetical protein
LIIGGHLYARRNDFLLQIPKATQTYDYIGSIAIVDYFVPKD